MSNNLDQYCRDYLDDALSPAERTRFEQRLAGGDKDLIEALNKQKSFRSSMSGSEKEQKQNTGAQASLFEDDQSELLNFVTGSKQSEEKDQPPKQETTSQPKAEESKPVTPPPPTANTSDKSGKEDQDEKNIYDVAREKSAITERKWVKVIIALLFTGLAVLLIYSSWQNFLMENKINVLQERQKLSEAQISHLENNLRTTGFERGRILDIMRSNFTTLNVITTEHEKLKRWVQLWDKGTLRTAVVLQEPNLSADEELQLWSYNLRDRLWQKAGSIDYAITDSIYTQWSSADLARSYRLRVILFNKQDSTERILGTQRVN